MFEIWFLELLWSLPVFTSFRRGRAEAESEGGDVGAWSFFCVQQTAESTASTTRSTLMPFMQRKSIGHSRRKHGEQGALDFSRRWRGPSPRRSVSNAFLFSS